MHPIQQMVTGNAIDKLVARVRFGVLTVAEALAHKDAEEKLSIRERAELARRLAVEE